MDVLKQWADVSEIRLLDAADRTIDGAFMDFGQDLWSPDGRRLTILFDPARIKRSVEGDGEIAAALQAGHSYTVELSGRRFQYHVTPAVRTAITPQTWRLALPKAGSREALTVTFDREMDDALMRDQLVVVDAQGRSQPGHGWRSGAYQLVVGSSLEDVSGNRVWDPREA